MPEAIKILEELATAQRAKLGPDHPETLATANMLAMLYRGTGRMPDAVRLHEEMVSAMKAGPGPDHPETLKVMNNLAAAYWDAGRKPEAIALFEQVAAARKAGLGPGHPETLLSLNKLAASYIAADMADKTPPVFGEILAVHRKQFGAEDPRLANHLAAIGATLIEHRQFAAAEPLLRECQAIRDAKEPDSWTAFDAKALLGAALAGLEKYDDAEPLLLAGFEGMKAREPQMPPRARSRLRAAADCLSRLYDSTAKPAEATRWRDERDKFPAEKNPPSRPAP